MSVRRETPVIVVLAYPVPRRHDVRVQLFGEGLWPKLARVNEGRGSRVIPRSQACLTFNFEQNVISDFKLALVREP